MQRVFPPPLFLVSNYINIPHNVVKCGILSEFIGTLF